VAADGKDSRGFKPSTTSREDLPALTNASKVSGMPCVMEARREEAGRVLASLAL
jgi:hypothetical protein